MRADMKASFIEPMLLLRTNILPEGPDWKYELKLDGYRALAIKTNGNVQLRSRNNNDFNLRYPAVVEALADMRVRRSLMAKWSRSMILCVRCTDACWTRSAVSNA